MKKIGFSLAIGALSILCLAPLASAGVCAPGDQAMVSWKGSQYPANVLKTDDNQTRCYIKYKDYGDEWNEWVGADRIKITVAAAVFKVGDPVKVKWKGDWYPASVLEVKDAKYKIHYDGYESSWDEWLGTDRIKAK